MRPSELTKSLECLIQGQLPTFIWGAPGIGKSSIVKQIAKKNGLEFLDLRLSLLDPTDLKGIPFFDPELRQGVWASPSFLPKEPHSKGVLFLDEINTAPPAVQASAYQLVLDRKVGEYELPEGWSIVSAGNRESDRGVVYRMPPALANRFVHLEMEVSLDDWKVWAYASNVSSELIAYLSYESEALFDFLPERNEKAFPTPRSWSYVDKILKSNMDSNLLLESIAGAVGKEEAVKFLNFLKVRKDLPDIQSLLEGKDLEIKDDSRVLQVLISGLVNALKDENTPQTISSVLNFSMRLPPEFAVLLVQEMQMAGINPEISEVWQEWVKLFHYLLD